MIDDVDRVRIGDRDHDAAGGVAAERQHEPLARVVDRQLVDQHPAEDVVRLREVLQVGHLELDRQRERELLVVDQAQAQQHLADASLARLALADERLLDRIERHAAARDEDLADARARARGPARRRDGCPRVRPRGRRLAIRG